MEISVASQLWAIVYSLAVGVFLGLSYDAVRITRVLAGLRPCTPTRLSSVNLPIIGRRAGEIKKRNRFFADVFVFCGDIIYFAFAAFVFLVFVFHANYGNGRWFIVGGCIVGFVLYILTVGRAVMLVSGTVNFILSAVFAYLMFFLLFPFRMICSRIVLPMVQTAKHRRNSMRTDRVQKGLARELKFI